MVTPRRDPAIKRADAHRRIFFRVLGGQVKLQSFDEIFKAMRRLSCNVSNLDLALFIEEQIDRGTIERVTFRCKPHYQLRDPALGPPLHPALAGEPGTAYAAFRRAEVLYLERSGWVLHEKTGKWTHPANTRASFWTEAALLHQIHADETLLVHRRLGLPIHSRLKPR